MSGVSNVTWLNRLALIMALFPIRRGCGTVARAARGIKMLSPARHREGCQPGDIVAFIELPDRLDQRRDGVARIPASRSVAELVFKVPVAHRVGVAAARCRL